MDGEEGPGSACEGTDSEAAVALDRRAGELCFPGRSSGWLHLLERRLQAEGPRAT